MLKAAVTMKRRIVMCLLTALLLTAVSLAQAQQPARMSRIGFLSAGSSSSITISPRVRGKTRSPPRAGAELVRLRVDVIVTTGPTATRPAKDATRTIPIVMTNDGDPVGNGFIASLARPGGNITGLATLAPEIT